jgi:hypothetical protein
MWIPAMLTLQGASEGTASGAAIAGTSAPAKKAMKSAALRSRRRRPDAMNQIVAKRPSKKRPS